MKKNTPVWVRIGTSRRNLNPLLKAGFVISANQRTVQVQIDDDTVTVPRQLVRVA